MKRWKLASGEHISTAPALSVDGTVYAAGQDETVTFAPNIVPVRASLGTVTFPEPLDLVYLDEGSPGLRFRAVTEGRPLYESRFGDFADYRAEAMLRYFDFRHYEDIFHASVLGLAA